MRNSLCIVFISLTTAFGAACAQQAPTKSSTVSSQPGRAMAAETVTASAIVTAIDRANRVITLKVAGGKTTEIVAGPEVRNFDQIALGDQVVVQYVRALTLELRKNSGPRQSVETTDGVRTKQGEKPGAAIGNRVTILADVVDVNQKQNTITLRGPKGNTLALDVQNPDHFKVVKVGDQVEADYVEALAVSVEKAPAK